MPNLTFYGSMIFIEWCTFCCGIDHGKFPNISTCTLYPNIGACACMWGQAQFLIDFILKYAVGYIAVYGCKLSLVRDYLA